MRFVAVSIVLTLASVARADPPGLTPVEPAAPATDSGSYRLQTAAFDVGTVLLGIASERASGGAGGLAIDAAIGTYVAGPALVHLYHHHPGRALASVALRVGLPLIGGYLGASSVNTSSPDCDECGIGAAILGGLVGMIAASAFDIGYLSRGETAAVQPSTPPPPAMPALAPTRSAVVGLAFAF